MEQAEILSVFRARCAQYIEVAEEQVYLEERGLVKLLCAKEFTVDSALELWKKWVDWRKSYRLDEVKHKEVQPIYETGEAF